MAVKILQRYDQLKEGGELPNDMVAVELMWLSL